MHTPCTAWPASRVTSGRCCTRDSGTGHWQGSGGRQRLQSPPQSLQKFCWQLLAVVLEKCFYERNDKSKYRYHLPTAFLTSVSIDS